MGGAETSVDRPNCDCLSDSLLRRVVGCDSRRVVNKRFSLSRFDSCAMDELCVVLWVLGRPPYAACEYLLVV